MSKLVHYHCIARLTILAFALLVTVPLITASAEDEVAPAKGGLAKPARLAGCVTDQAGLPVARVRVVAAIPGMDMRKLYVGKDVKTVEATTNEQGRYEMIFPAIDKPTDVSIDAMKPQFERFSGIPMMRFEPLNVTLNPARSVGADLQLRPSNYFAGIVVDENGSPLEDIEVHASTCTATSSGWIETTRTNSKGKFEIFNYPNEPFTRGDKNERGSVSFTHLDYLDQEIDDVYQLDEDSRTTLRIVMPFGNLIAGTLRRPNGQPAANVLVRAIASSTSHVRKAAMTDQAGRFVLKGLPDGKATVSSHDFAGDEKVQRILDLAADEQELDLQLESISLPRDFKTYEVLGMQMTDVNAEWKAAYDFWSDQGALILNPGNDAARFKIGEMEKGDYFWMAGDVRIATVKEFVDQIITEAESQQGPPFSIRIVYTFSRMTIDGSNTQYMQLSQAEIEGLKRLRDEIDAAVK